LPGQDPCMNRRGSKGGGHALVKQRGWLVGGTGGGDKKGGTKSFPGGGGGGEGVNSLGGGVAGEGSLFRKKVKNRVSTRTGERNRSVMRNSGKKSGGKGVKPW